MIIRKAAKKDGQDLIKLFRAMVAYHQRIYTKDDKFYNREAESVREIWKRFINKNIPDKSSQIWIAHDNGKPVAYAIGLIKENIPVYSIKRYGFISDLYVDQKYRGKGVGKKLIDRLREFFRKEEIKFISLEVNHNNYDSIRFYEKCGFKEYHKTMRMRI